MRGNRRDKETQRLCGTNVEKETVLKDGRHITRRARQKMGGEAKLFLHAEENGRSGRSRDDTFWPCAACRIWDL